MEFAPHLFNNTKQIAFTFTTRMLVILFLGAGIFIPLIVSPANAKFGSDKNWPCIQRKVLKLTVGEVWNSSIIDFKYEGWRNNKDAVSLVENILPRRVPLDDARTAIAEFAKTHNGNELNPLLIDVFLGLFNQINSIRTTVMSGIERYDKRQKQLADKINKQRRRVSELEKIDEPNKEQDKELEQLDRSLEWDIRIHEEREQSLEYVCEVPVILSQRLYQLSKELQKYYRK